jgi:hypothetical protein
VKTKEPAAGEAPRKEHRSKSHKKRRHSALKKAAAAARAAQKAPAADAGAAAPPQASPAPPPKPPPQLDVELVPVTMPVLPKSSPVKPRQSRDLLNLSRRDVIMLIIGAAGGLGAFGAGYLVSQWLGKDERPPESAPQP